MRFCPNIGPKNETDKCRDIITIVASLDGTNMSLKKELLNELSETELKKLAEAKGITFNINAIRKNYYDGWDEKDKLVDLMSEYKTLTINDIEQFITAHRS